MHGAKRFAYGGALLGNVRSLVVVQQQQGGQTHSNAARRRAAADGTAAPSECGVSGAGRLKRAQHRGEQPQTGVSALPRGTPAQLPLRLDCLFDCARHKRAARAFSCGATSLHEDVRGSKSNGEKDSDEM